MIGLIGFLLFLDVPPLFDWDEVNFAESAREMIVSGNYLQVQIDFQPFYEKPPFFFWLQALSMHVFGVNAFAARFPNAIMGVITLLLLYQTGHQWKGQLMGRIISGLYLGTMLSTIYFKTGIIDPVFNGLIFLGMIQLIRFERLRKTEPASDQLEGLPYAAGFWIALATLTKGPVALLITMVVYGLYKAIFDRFRIPILPALKFFGAWTLLVAGWYGVITLIYGIGFLEYFINYQAELFTQNVAGHQQPFYYHFVVFVLGCFPLSAFAFRGMFHRSTEPDSQLILRWMNIWFWSVMIIFSIATTKIVHYSSMLYFPGVFLGGHYLFQKIKKEESLTWDVYLIWGLGAIVWGIIPIGINWFMASLPEMVKFVDAPLVAASMQLSVAWTGWEWMIGALFLMGLMGTLYLFLQKQYLRAIMVQAVVTLLFVNLQYAITLPKVSQYTQSVLSDFYEELKGKDVYIMTEGHKTYLPYFIREVLPQEKPNRPDKLWLTEGSIDKDVYLSVPQHKIDAAFRETFRNFDRLYAKGGYAFYLRKSHIDPGMADGNSTNLIHVRRTRSNP